MIRLAFAEGDAALVPPADLHNWPDAAELGKLTLDKADGSTWWDRRGKAEQEIQTAARALSRHIAQRRRRRALEAGRSGARLRKARRALSILSDGGPGAGDSGTSWKTSRPAIPWIGSSAATSGSARPRSRCGRPRDCPVGKAGRHRSADHRPGKAARRDLPKTVWSAGYRGGSLSRATSAQETRETKEGLRRGKLKIVVGTQALLSKDVKFAALGLVVIDEEQHFGAAEKAKLSSLAKGVHTLWMSATPIPRTLAAGLAGFRDLSVMATPPVHRLPVVTKIAPLSDAAIVAALLREQKAAAGRVS